MIFMGPFEGHRHIAFYIIPYIPQYYNNYGSYFSERNQVDVYSVRCHLMLNIVIAKLGAWQSVLSE